MPLSKLTEYLDSHDKKYMVIKHSNAYTAQEVAASAHIPGREMAKTVMANIDGKMSMIVTPSTHIVDFDRVKDALGITEADLASEEEFKDLFPGCELGAMPPFGNLFNMDTYVAEALAEDEEIAFNAGNHRELVKMRYDDFEELVEPTVIALAKRYA
ncbi:aminoacyl-tRNA deacylase [Fodinibius saliphilus]|uniref:aminoacyl-tRNA deacylase n=1 Tax=Fodinibius saliphilus TaxID=1920650 RepID=UPI0011086D52|nr:YbaK/EbsC family protein [Fodinibius saliphilus]